MREEGGNDDARLYNWMIEILTSSLGAGGAGRVNDVAGATLYPNMRLSGLADFAELRFLDDLIADDQMRRQADRRIEMYSDSFKDNGINYTQAALLGDMLFSFSLVIDEYLLRREELDYEHEVSSEETFLGQSLRMLFEEAYRVFTGEEILPEEVLDLNYALLRENMGFSLTEAYVPHVLNQTMPDTIYQGATVIFKELGASWTDDRGWDHEKKTYAVPSRNPDLKVVRRSHDLGAYNGANTLQELIRSLYRVTTMMILGQHAAQIPDEPVVSAEDLKERVQQFMENREKATDLVQMLESISNALESNPDLDLGDDLIAAIFTHVIYYPWLEREHGFSEREWARFT